jgi:hypothetical protein
MDRADFIFTIGYQGNTAIVDTAAKRRYGGLRTAQLIEKGLYKAAFCSALFSGNREEMEAVLQAYNAVSSRKYETLEELKRAYGVYEIPGDGVKTKGL